MCRQNHGVAADYFAVGVIAYEFMLGRVQNTQYNKKFNKLNSFCLIKRPYLGRSRKEIRDAILAKQIQVKKYEIPPNWSLEGGDFINKVPILMF